MLEDLSKYASLVLSMCLCLNLTLRGRGKFHYQQFYNFEPAESWVNHSKAHEINFYSIFATFVSIFYLPGRIDSFSTVHISFQYIAALSVSLRYVFPGCCR